MLHNIPKPKGALAAREEEVLKFWNEEEIFKKTLEKPSPRGEFTFYDGPPFANGLPHYGHILASTIKDAIPRYRTMQGYRVPRRWGWDCHGLPVENLVEKELGLKSKRDIEELGIEKFNETARRSIMKDVADWKRIIPRLGRWADMENDYKTLDPTYTESVWWAFKKLHTRGLIYEGFKAMHMCPRCGTTLSNFEVAQGYLDIDDVAVTVKLPLIDEPNTSLLIWTTTPWTLPGNAAAAVNPDATYVKVKQGEEFYIVAKERAAAVFEHPEVVEEFPAKKIIGKKYLPPFDYFATELHKHKSHAWKVYGASYVTMEDGTGVVHIAPAFGAEDLELAQKQKIPLIHHVTEEGKFVATVRDFEGLSVKPKGNPRETDEKVAALLEERKLLFKKEKIKHSYPHCWRCDTPLLNWAATSWFVNVTLIKKNLLAQNANVSWVPEHVGTGRFNNGLQSAPDWAISRSRYWGAPIPVWRHTKTKEIKIAGSVEELLSMVRKSGNNYFVMRHGEARSNVEQILDSEGDPENHLTDNGKARVALLAKNLQGKHIDLIITSPFLRTRETSAIVQRELKLPDSAVMVDERLRETGLGIYSGKSIKEWRAFFGSMMTRFAEAPEGGESFTQIRQRVGEFLFDIEQRYSGKNILIVSHGNPIWLMNNIAARIPSKDLHREELPAHGEAKPLAFVPFPHNAHYELDLHRPYIDEIPMGDTLKGEWKRVPDVFDCWFESGSMPFASNHYPFEKKTFNPRKYFGLAPLGYPANFIAEGIDQTRGWFYSLIVLGVALFGKSPYKNVIVNGLVLASDGQKMSKRLRNYPDPMEVVEKYGADSLRYYLLSSSVIRAEDLRFKEQGVDEVQKKLLMRLDNVRSFYDLYADAMPRSTHSGHVLDRWILARLAQTLEEITKGYESYELDVATRPLMGFVDDLSNWYVRRSRDRFKENTADTRAALATLRHVLYTIAHAMAPVMPFYADDLFGRVKEEGDAQSVHLSSWPQAGTQNVQLITDMESVRAACSKGLELRERANIKIRQPLASLTVKTLPADEALRALIAGEVNVKEVKEDTQLHEDALLDTELTPHLRNEGYLRELIRAVQDMRKKQNYSIGDRPSLSIATNVQGQKFIEEYSEVLAAETGLSQVRFVPLTENTASGIVPFPIELTLHK